MQSFINVETPGPIVTRPTLNGDVEYDRAAYSSSEMVDVHRGSWLSKDRKQSEPVSPTAEIRALILRNADRDVYGRWL